MAAEWLYAGDLPKPPVDKDTFVKLAEMSSLNVIMSTHHGYYKQTDGLAMGSPPAPYLANIWLSNFDPVISERAKLYQRYMDDILTVIKKSMIDSKLVEINQLHENLKFTIEKESEGRLPFLDLCLLHNNKTVKTTWYSKPTDTGLIMNFHTVAPRKYKRAVVQGFVHRIARACSSWDTFHDSMCRAKQVLERNQYPPEFYDPIIMSTIEKFHTQITNEQNGNQADPESKTAAAVPPTPAHMWLLQYRGRPTDSLLRQLSKLNTVKITTVLTLRKLNTLVPSLKPKVPNEIRSRVVYSITCPGCQASYVGCTIRHMNARLAEHRSIKQPVGKHFNSCVGTKPEIEDVTILQQTPRTVDYLLALESLFIKEREPELNTKDEYRSRQLTLNF